MVDLQVRGISTPNPLKPVEPVKLALVIITFQKPFTLALGKTDNPVVIVQVSPSLLGVVFNL